MTNLLEDALNALCLNQELKDDQFFAGEGDESARYVSRTHNSSV